MSLLPLLFSAWWADLERPHRLLDQHFGMGLYPEQLMFSSSDFPFWNNKAALEWYYRPLTEIARRLENGGTSTITADKDTFKVMLDVQQFKPEEISVKLSDRTVVVEAKHEERKDEHGLISRQFIRKYWLPEQVEVDKLSSNISSDGVLTITAPLKEEAKPNERTIKIEYTGKPAIRAEKTTEGTTTTTTTTTGSTEKPIEESTEEKREETTDQESTKQPEESS